MTIVVTRATGGTAKRVGGLCPPERQVSTPARPTLAEAGVDARFVADLLSACLAHERCGVHLYRSVAGRTADPNCGSSTSTSRPRPRPHRRLEELIAAADGDPQYVSPSARATEKAAPAWWSRPTC